MFDAGNFVVLFIMYLPVLPLIKWVNVKVIIVPPTGTNLLLIAVIELLILVICVLSELIWLVKVVLIIPTCLIVIFFLIYFIINLSMIILFLFSC